MEFMKTKKENIIIVVIAVMILALLVILLIPKNEIEVQNVRLVINETNIKLDIGESKKINLSVTPNNTQLVYKSSDEQVAIVDAYGNVIGLKNGQATINISTIDKKNSNIVLVSVESEAPHLEVTSVVVENSNTISKKYVNIEDTLTIRVNFNQQISKNLRVLLNDKQVNYNLTTNQNYIVFVKEITENEKLLLKIYDENKLIYTYNSFPTIDTTRPTCSLIKNNGVIQITGKDDFDIYDYAITNNKANIDFSNNQYKAYDKTGVWYGYARDMAGNVGSCEINLIKTIDPSDIIIIGDSRMESLCHYDWYKVDNGVCISKIGMGYSWLNNTAIANVNSYLNQNNKEYYITTNLGVNDLGNIAKYIAKYRELAIGAWQKYQIFIISVNPTDGEHDYENEAINNFNIKIKNGLSDLKNVTYCDTNSQLSRLGFKTGDGLHYNQDSSKKIYQLIKDCLYDYYN